jgi:hypothetical protein
LRAIRSAAHGMTMMAPCVCICLFVIGLTACRSAVPDLDAPDDEPVDAAAVVRWERIETDRPAEIWESGAAYDPATGSIVQHGGHAIGSYAQSSHTFVHDLETRKTRRSMAAIRPQRRCLTDLVHVDSLGRVLTGNGASSHGSLPQGQLAADYRSIVKGDPRGPWLYDSVADDWEDARPLGAVWERYPHGQLAYDAVHDVVLHLAGSRLALYSPRTNQVLSRELPAALRDRDGYGIVALGRTGTILLFGGRAGGEILDDTWIYDAGADRWEEVSTAIRPPRGLPMSDFLELDLTFHAPLGRALLWTVPAVGPIPTFSAWPSPELWAFDPLERAWNQIAVEGDSPAFPGLLVSASDRDVLVLVGGGRDGPPANDPRPALSRELWLGRIDVPPATRATESAPDGVRVETTASTIELSWSAVAGESYEVWRAAAAPLPGIFEHVATVSGDRWTAAPLSGDAFAYRVVVVGRPLATGSLPAFDQPLRPRGLVASVETATRVVLRWSAAHEPDVVGYHVYRATGAAIATGHGTRLTTSPHAATTFVDNTIDLGDGVIRGYWVVAVNRGGIASGPSPLAYSTPDAPRNFRATARADRTTALVQWEWPADRAVAGFRLYMSDHHENTLGYSPQQTAAWWAQWTPVTTVPITGRAIEVPLSDPVRDYYFYARAVSVLGQAGFHTDITSPTDPRFDGVAAP